MAEYAACSGENVSENADLLTFRMIDYLVTHELLATNTSSPRAAPMWRREPQKSCCDQLYMLGAMVANRLGFGPRRD